MIGSISVNPVFGEIVEAQQIKASPGRLGSLEIPIQSDAAGKFKCGCPIAKKANLASKSCSRWGPVDPIHE